MDSIRAIRAASAPSTVDVKAVEAKRRRTGLLERIDEPPPITITITIQSVTIVYQVIYGGSEESTRIPRVQITITTIPSRSCCMCSNQANQEEENECLRHCCKMDEEDVASMQVLCIFCVYYYLGKKSVCGFSLTPPRPFFQRRLEAQKANTLGLMERAKAMVEAYRADAASPNIAPGTDAPREPPAITSSAAFTATEASGSMPSTVSPIHRVGKTTTLSQI